MDVVGYSPFANLSEADVSIKPLNWTGKSESELDLVKGAELGPVDLAYARAPGVFLARANLLFADLRGAILYSGDLRGASLLYAGLTGADLEHADLSGATLIFADLTDADLKSTNLTGAKLRWANLTRADLTTANLTGADLGGADLARADLVAANLTRASLAGAKLVGADLSNADLMFADFRPGVSSPFVMRIEKTVGLTAYALKTAKNWNKAYYDDELRQQLGLPPEYNQKLEDEQKREEQQKASPP